MLYRWYWIIYTTLQNIPMLTIAIAYTLCSHPGNDYIKIRKLDLHEVKNQILKASVFERTKWHKLLTEFLWGIALQDGLHAACILTELKTTKTWVKIFDFGYSHHWLLRTSPSLPPACWARQCPPARTSGQLQLLTLTDQHELRVIKLPFYGQCNALF